MSFNPIDTIIEYISPRTALKRKMARNALEKIRGYEAASSKDRVKNWKTTGASADAVVGPALQKLRDRVRDLIRNDSLALKAQRSLATYMVGTGIVGQAEGNDINSRKFNEYFVPWCNSKFCDYDGKYDLYGLQYLMALTLVASGSCIIKKEIPRPNEIPDDFIPLQIRLLEPDFIDLNRTELKKNSDGSYIKQGIEYNKKGKVIAYWLFEHHPGEVFPYHLGSNYESKRVPADEMELILLKTRPGQNHAVPWLSAVAMVLKDYNDFEDAHLVRQKVAACFTAFIEDIEPPETTGSGKVKKPNFDKLEPATVEIVPTGRTMKFSDPPGVQGYGEYTRGQKHRIAAGTMLTYEALTSDLSQVNFSSARIGQQDMYNHIDVWRKLVIIPQFCEVVKEWFCDMAFIAGKLRSCNVLVTWTPPRRPFIEPTKDVKAKSEEVKNGFGSLFEILRSLGKNPKEFLENYANELKFLDELGLKLSSDPRSGNVKLERKDDGSEEENGNQTTTSEDES